MLNHINPPTIKSLGTDSRLAVYQGGRFVHGPASSVGQIAAVTATFATPAIVRKIGEKLNDEMASSADLGHSPDATASFNDGALQAAIDGIFDETKGGILRIPRGLFQHSAQIDLPKTSGKRVILEGSGEATHLHFPAAAPMNALYVGSAVAAGGSGVTLRDFKITSDTDDYVTGVYLENANTTKIERLSFDTLLEGIVSDTTFGCRYTNNHAISLGADFFRAASRTHGNLWLANSVFTIVGYLANFEDAGNNISNVFVGNDTEVCGGIIKNAGILYALTYDGNYMEQASGDIFDFNAAVYGSIRNNTFQSSPSNQIDNFKGIFDGNHCFDQAFTWGATSTPQIGQANIATGTGSIGQSRKTFTPVLEGSTGAGTGTYTTQSGTYTRIEDRIFFDISLTWTAHTGTGNMKITGLPVTNSGNTVPCTIRTSNLTYSGDLVAAVSGASTDVTIQSQATGAALAQVAMDTAGTITISGHYRADI